MLPRELQDIIDEIETECPEDDLNALKADVAYVCGIEIDSTEWFELLDI